MKQIKECYKLGGKDQLEKIRQLRSKAVAEGDKSSQAALKNQKQEAYERARGSKKLWYKVKTKINSIHNAIKYHLVSNYGLVSLGNMTTKNVIKKSGCLPKKKQERFVDDETV